MATTVAMASLVGFGEYLAMAVDMAMLFKNLGLKL